MQKIEFKDLPDTTTPITADNLNLLQDNIENVITPMQNSLLNLVGKGYDNVDLNDMTTTGIYYMRTGITNTPPSATGYLYLLVMHVGNSTDLVQMAIRVAETPQMFLRCRLSSQGITNWENWKEIG